MGRAPVSADPEARVPDARPGPDLAARIHLGVLAALQLVMALELALLLWRGDWLAAVLVLAIMGITLAPVVLRHRLPVSIPAEFQVLTVIFVFASLFLGEIRSYYEQIGRAHV